MRRVLLEPGAHHLLNAGDTAMLRVASARARELWPDAAVGVITEAPESLAAECPGTVPVPAAGRNAWLEEPVLGRLVHQLLPGSAAVRLRRAERRVQARWPRAVAPVVRARDRLRGAGGSELGRFLDWSGSSDVVIVTGAGLLTDEFAPRAVSVLTLLDSAARRGAATALMGQGVSMLTDPELLGVSRRVLPRVDLVGLREERTGPAVLAALGVPDSKILITGDDALELAWTSRDRARGRGVGIAIRVARYSGISDEMASLVAGVVTEISAARGVPVVPVPISRAAYEQDAAVLRRMLGTDETETEAAGDPIEAVRRCRVVVAGSYHAAVFALAQGIPAVGVAASGYYLQKFEGLAGQYGGGFSFVRLDDDQAAQRLRRAVGEAWDLADELRADLLAGTQRQIAAGQRAYAQLSAIAAARRPAVTRGSARTGPRMARLAGGLRRRAAPLLVTRMRYNCASQRDSGWDERAEVAVGLLKGVLGTGEAGREGCLQIADLGCGNERLRPALQAGLGREFAYRGYDRRPQSPAVERINLRRRVPAGHFDAVFCLGLLEYIPRVEPLARRLAGIGTNIIVSYVIADSESGLTSYDRWARQWRHSYTRSQFEDIFRRAGLRLEACGEAESGETVLWAWRSRR